jgi:hypothetical protein
LQKDIEVLEKVQMRAINMINGLHGAYEEKLRAVGLKSLADRRNELDMVLVYKILNGKCFVKCENWFKIEGEHEGLQKLR